MSHTEYQSSKKQIYVYKKFVFGYIYVKTFSELNKMENKEWILMVVQDI